MCLPAIPIAIQTALTIASTVASVTTGVMGAKAQERANDTQYKNSVTARNSNFNQLNLQSQQEAENASQKISENNIKASEALATSRTAAGEHGVAGLSVAALLDNLANNRSGYNMSVMENNDRKQMAIAGQRVNVDTNAANQVANLKTPAMPNYLGAGLQIAGDLYKDPAMKKQFGWQ
jgi:hypothetical protein